MKKIAIVDDDNIFQFTTKVKIEKLNLAEDISIYNDGEEIFDYLKTCAVDDLPDVLLLDINMPLVDGWDFLELYETLSDDKKNRIHIFMLSSSINPVDLEKAENHPHIKRYVTKPIKDEILIDIIK